MIHVRFASKEVAVVPQSLTQSLTEEEAANRLRLSFASIRRRRIERSGQQFINWGDTARK